jgi:hypothetical protein
MLDVCSDPGPAGGRSTSVGSHGRMNQEAVPSTKVVHGLATVTDSPTGMSSGHTKGLQKAGLPPSLPFHVGSNQVASSL